MLSFPVLHFLNGSFRLLDYRTTIQGSAICSHENEFAWKDENMLVPETLLRKKKQGEVVVEIGAGRELERVLRQSFNPSRFKG